MVEGCLLYSFNLRAELCSEHDEGSANILNALQQSQRFKFSLSVDTFRNGQ